MISTNILKELNVGEVIENANMKEYTTYKLDGIIDYIVYPENIDKLVKLINWLVLNNIKYKVLGNGSNVIFRNNKYDGVIIKLDVFNNLEVNNDIVYVGSGYPMIKLALVLTKKGLSGLEFASGIPGTVGGAIYMNAGAYKSDMSKIVKSVTVLRNDKVITLSNDDMKFGYRTNILHNTKDIVLYAELKLEHGNVAEMVETINRRKKRRLDSQPIDKPTCGSVFRNPEGHAAWQLIDGCGLKGYKVGDAMVSDMHANFIVNSGNATANDIIKLIEYIELKVKEKYNIDLISEQEIVE